MKVYVGMIRKDCYDDILESYSDILGVYDSFELAKERALSYVLQTATKCGVDFKIDTNDWNYYSAKVDDGISKTTVEITEKILLTEE